MCYAAPMTKNLTLAIDENLLDKARVLAAIRRTSVNEMVRDFLTREVSREAHQAARAEIWNHMFEDADRMTDHGARPAAPGVSTSGREGFYGEVMRERGLL